MKDEYNMTLHYMRNPLRDIERIKIEINKLKGMMKISEKMFVNDKEYLHAFWSC